MRKINLKNFKVATSLTARDINRRIILNVIRTRQPISRADVARHTGLQRSTVSLIADQLIEEGWVAEGEFGRLPRGRRPIYLQLNAERAGVIGINVRPTTTTIALADLNGQFLDQQNIPTRSDPKVFVKELSAAVKAFMKRSSGITFEGIGVSLPGRIYRDTQRLATAPNLGWTDIDVKGPLEKATQLSVEVENAANACALAENYFGQQSDGADNLIAVTISEGIGTGIIMNGQLMRGSTGMAGEFGHVALDLNGPTCRCGNRGCWEAFASNTAALRLYRDSKKNVPEDMTMDDLLNLVQDGDQKGIIAVETMAKYLGHGLAMLVTGFEPNVIILIGEITRVWSRIEPIIQGTVAEHLQERSKTRIVPVDDVLQPRLRGTIALVLEKHLGAPSVA